jgi:hypothetical protein
MKIFKNASLNCLGYENLEEKSALNNPTLKIKLAYNLGEINGEYIQITAGKNFKFDESKNQIQIPNFLTNLNESAYYLRLALDSNAIKNGNLPLHGAACEKDGKILFIFGDTNQGKSYTLNELISFTNPIGDDHIVVGSKEILGNDYIRNRANKNSIKSLIKTPVLDHKRYEILLVDIQKRNGSLNNLFPDEIIRNKSTLESILKYGLMPPINSAATGIFENHLMNQEIRQKYFDMFKSFLFNAKSWKYATNKKGIEEAIEKWK